MMDYKSILLDTVYSDKFNKGMSFDELVKLYGIKSSEDFKALLKAINELENEYVIIRDYRERYFLLETLGYFIGELRKNPKGFGFVENDDLSVYASRYEIAEYLDGDQVLARIIHNKDGSDECEIVKVIKHNFKLLIGVIKKKNRRTYFLPDKPMPGNQFKITNVNQHHLVNDTKVQVYIEKFGETLECKIVKILGHKYDPGIDILSILLEHDIEPTFPSQVINEVDKIEEEVSEDELKERLDLRNELTITIDGDEAKDLDDAISVKKIDKGYRLGVHIADVSFYVKAGSAIDKEALKRSTSVYVVDRVVPMLPHALSNGICSLNPKVNRLTLSCIMDINMQGEVIDYTIAPSVIKTTERMTYNNVNKILNGDAKAVKRYEHLVAMIDVAQELALVLRKRKQHSGQIGFDTPESVIKVDDLGRVISITPRVRQEAEMIIEDFMIAANECVASHTKHMELPSIYRVHETPELKKMRDFVHIAQTMGYQLKGSLDDLHPKQLQQLLNSAQGNDNYEVLATYMLRSMRKARYDANCLGHFGLALSEYTHFTSPIRRYPDLLVHRMLRKYYFQGNIDPQEIEKDENFIDEASDHTSKKERNAIECEREVDDMKKCEYMEQFIGQMFEGVISGVTKFGFFVALANTVEGLVHVSHLTDDHYNYDDNLKALRGERTNKLYQMGMKVKVRLIEANRFKKQIDFEIIEERKRGK